MRISNAIILVLALPFLFTVVPLAAEEGGEDCLTIKQGAKCGTDIVFSQVTCGGQVCKLDEVFYDAEFYVESSAAGFAEPVDYPCYKHEITRTCVNGICSEASYNTTAHVTGQRATGRCVSDPPGGGE